MAFSKIRIRGDIKANWESANPILAEREWGVEWETTIGVGEVNIKIGNGSTAWNDLDYASVKNITKKIVATFATISDANPTLNAGESLETLFGKIKKKFDYLASNKLDKSAKYDGVDSTSTDLYATANSVRQVNVKADKNASDITTINSNLSKKLGFKTVIMDDTPATNIEELLKKKLKFIYDADLGEGFYALVGGWQGNNYGFGIASVASGMIILQWNFPFATYRAFCDFNSELSGFQMQSDQPIKYQTISLTINENQWITSANGLKYYNYNKWTIPNNALGIATNILTWQGASDNITCSVYNNNYIQFRSVTATSWTGTVQISYCENFFYG